MMNFKVLVKLYRNKLNSQWWHFLYNTHKTPQTAIQKSNSRSSFI